MAKWSWSGKNYGWSLALQRKKRTLVYLIPGEGFFTASTALGEKACAAAEEAGWIRRSWRSFALRSGTRRGEACGWRCALRLIWRGCGRWWG